MRSDSPHQNPKGNGQQIFLQQCIFMFFFLMSCTCLAASGDPHRYQESGELTDIEQNSPGSINVIISGRGYTVDTAVLVVSQAGLLTTLDKIDIPALVNFEYKYVETSPKMMSPIIVYIKESREKNHSERSNK